MTKYLCGYSAQLQLTVSENTQMVQKAESGGHSSASAGPVGRVHVCEQVTLACAVPPCTSVS